MSRLRLWGIVGAVALAMALALGGAGSALAFGPWGQTQTPGGGTGPGWGCGGGGGGQGGMMGGWGWRGNRVPAGEPIAIQAAKEAVENYVRAGNWREELVVDEVMEFEYNYYAIVKEKATGVGAFEVLIDKNSGRVTPEMGPNMMWNTKYGHMRGFGGSLFGGMGGMMRGLWGQGGNGWWGPSLPPTPSAEMPVGAAEAIAKADEYLAANGSDHRAEDPRAFYGYYTLHSVDGDGRISGMLSVNGHTGAVWFHGWHGDFIQIIGGEHD